ncbi:hypothetical protein [Streptomyces sp. NBC_00212]|uniref:hypothetical protein n=1 Tax=Streptomyces sp. NBC_00212 TaxID=2975684 RepID=UPI00324937B8
MATGHDRDAIDPYTATETLREALTAAGIVLPSLGTDGASPHLGLVTLGNIRADVALKLADTLRRGCA